ncbi:hypothetical protein [Pyxidicoccus xibeiensis]|uniref:hypothetical protein n=1 Tax=Pyxidicoccus xibeiensis TaxID=2906759 RepID=UPI0020A7E7E2|nr:hypothetical protein [Pyxidicoccus xibeiensis]MCP3140104.1 hypothetical protein [Pyxidicoccus xibeiensis]
MASSRVTGRQVGMRVGWLLLAALACTSAGSKTRAAEESVQRFFAALPSGDCAVLEPLLATGGGARPCEQTVQELREHGFSLVGIVESRVDGRDSEAVIVRARVARDGVERQEPWLLRVERQAGAWRVRF